MWDAIIQAGVANAGAILGGIATKNAVEKELAKIQQRKAENENWYNRRYNEDATQRADAKRALQRAEEFFKERNQNAARTQAVMGGTEESVAASKIANAQALADATSQVVANNEQRKDAIENRYLNQKDKLEDQEAEARQRRNLAVQNAIAGGVFGLGNSMANTYSSLNQGGGGNSGGGDQVMASGLSTKDKNELME